MIPNNQENKKVKLTATIIGKADQRLDEDAKITGNKSYVVNKIICEYYGLSPFPEFPEIEKEQEKIAS